MVRALPATSEWKKKMRRTNNGDDEMGKKRFKVNISNDQCQSTVFILIVLHATVFILIVLHAILFFDPQIFKISKISKAYNFCSGQ